MSAIVVIRVWGPNCRLFSIRQREGNGHIERFFRMLEERLLWIENFRESDKFSAVRMAFRSRYNASWMVQRLGYRTPLQARHDFMLALPSAA